MVIRIERSTSFPSKGLRRIYIDLSIEENNARIDSFDIMYLNVNGEEFAQELIGRLAYQLKTKNFSYRENHSTSRWL